MVPFEIIEPDFEEEDIESIIGDRVVAKLCPFYPQHFIEFRRRLIEFVKVSEMGGHTEKSHIGNQLLNLTEIPLRYNPKTRAVFFYPRDLIPSASQDWVYHITNIYPFSNRNGTPIKNVAMPYMFSPFRIFKVIKWKEHSLFAIDFNDDIYYYAVDSAFHYKATTIINPSSDKLKGLEVIFFRNENVSRIIASTTLELS